MLFFRAPQKVRLFVAFIFSDHALFKRSLKDLSWHFGNPDLVSSDFPFVHTSYYRDEMGENLVRVFVSFPRHVDAHADLVRAKKIAVKIENRYAKNGKRTVNIDPGYINESRMVLSTTKDFSHRNYLGSKIFVEVTMLFQSGQWKSLPWTFPDYATGMYDVFFNTVRNAYRTHKK